MHGEPDVTVRIASIQGSRRLTFSSATPELVGLVLDHHHHEPS
jgi:hypothetical protein